MTRRHPRPNKTIESDDARKTINFTLSPLLHERLDLALDASELKKHEFIAAALEFLLEKRDARPESNLASELDPAVLELIAQVDPEKAARIRSQVMALQGQTDVRTFRYVARPLIETGRVISYVSQDLKARVDALADRDGVTLRTLFRTALTLYLDEDDTLRYEVISNPLTIELEVEADLLETIEARALEEERAPERLAIQAIDAWLDERAKRAGARESDEASSIGPTRYIEPPAEVRGVACEVLSLVLDATLYHRLQRRMGLDMMDPEIICYTALVETFDP